VTLVQALIMSIVEGVTEFLPVSSTAHLVLASKLMGISQTGFVKSFEIAIQLGAILAVVVLYFKDLTANYRVWPKIILAFVPTAVLGFIFYGFVKSVLLGNSAVTSIALAAGGLLFIVIERVCAKLVPALNTNTHGFYQELAKLPSLKLLGIGVMQSVSMIPGVSRSAASIAGGMLVGLTKQTAIKFSFILAIPTMLAATSLDLYKSGFMFNPNELTVLTIGFLGSFGFALLAVKTFTGYLQKHSFVLFGIYRITIGLLWFFVLM